MPCLSQRSPPGTPWPIHLPYHHNLPFVCSLFMPFTAANTSQLRRHLPCRIARSRPCFPPLDGTRRTGVDIPGSDSLPLLRLVTPSPPSSTRRSQCPTMPHCKSMARLEPVIGPGHVFWQASGSLGGRNATRTRAKIGGVNEERRETPLRVPRRLPLPCRALQRPGPPGAPGGHNGITVCANASSTCCCCCGPRSSTQAHVLEGRGRQRRCGCASSNKTAIARNTKKQKSKKAKKAKTHKPTNHVRQLSAGSPSARLGAQFSQVTDRHACTAHTSPVCRGAACCWCVCRLRLPLESPYSTRQRPDLRTLEEI
jgi:hypothetical protein